VSKTISRDELKPKIEPHFWQFLDNSHYEVVSQKASRLLSFNRLDIAVKALFLEFADDRPNFSEALYAAHLKCFTLGSFKEPGNPLKDSLRSYVQEFEATHQSLLTNGFDSAQSLIPLGKGGTILNGAHRVTSALVCDKSVSAVALPIADPMYDYRFFLGRGMSQAEVEIAVSKFIELQSNCFVACVWPRAEGKRAELDSLFSRVVYKKSLKLSYTGAHNFLAEVYAGETWLGSQENRFAGAKGKLVECFASEGELRAYAFQADSLEDVVKLKDEIRELFGVGKHSVHITDTHEEAVRISRLLFNENSLHFLEFGDPYAFKDTFNKIESFGSFLDKAGIKRSDAMLDSSIVLSLYGLREARDLDFLSIQDLGQTPEDLDPHDSELKYHGKKKVDLLFDNSCFFYYRNIKFVSLPQLAEMKRSRREEKDVRDLQLMAPLLQKNGIGLSLKLLQRLFFIRAKGRHLIIQALRKVHLYELAKSAYRFLRRGKGG
jgi:hypothetical protein